VQSPDVTQVQTHGTAVGESSCLLKHLNAFFILPCFAVAGLLFSAPSEAAGIYVLAEENGSISLSNVQENPRYKMLMTDDPRSPVEPLRSEQRKGLRNLADKARFDQVVEQTALSYGLEGALLHAVISVESGYNPAAVSRKGASGLMQLMPKTALRYGVADILDPAQNIQGGARYLRDLLKLFNSDLELVIAAYNAGEHAVARYGNQIPPYRETVAYVPRVMAYYQKYQAGSVGSKVY